MSIPTIKPIETHYNGYRFRSRLEARWAVFFDVAGISYEYEPEGFELGNGIRYLPDFKTSVGWIEIKPVVEESEAIDRMWQDNAETWLRFAAIVEPLHVLFGTPELPMVEDKKLMSGSFASVFAQIVNDGCSEVNGQSRFESRPFIFQERRDGSVLLWPVPAFEPVEDGHPESFIGLFDGDIAISMVMNPGVTKFHDSKKLKAAYKAARQARFEHGEKPNGR